MKNKIILVIVLAVVFIFLCYRAYDLYDKSSVLKGKYEVLVKNTNTFKKLLGKTIKEKTQEIASLNANITLAKESILKKESALCSQNRELMSITEQLETNYALNEDLIDTWTARVGLKDKELTTWKEKFTLAMSIIKDKDSIIFDLTKKYEAQLKISIDWESLYTAEHTAHLILRKRFKLCETKLRITRLTRSVGFVAIAVAGGYILYTNLREN